MTTRRNWIVVADAARARLLEFDEAEEGWRHVADLVHPQSRQSGVELAALRGGDRPGHVEGTGHGLGSAAYQPHTDPRQREHEAFAHQVAATVNHAVASGQCGTLTLVASPAFLGRLTSNLSEQARRLVSRSVDSDFTKLEDADILRRLGIIKPAE